MTSAAGLELRASSLSPATPHYFLKPTQQTPPVSVRKEAAGFHSVVPSDNRSYPPMSSAPAHPLICPRKHKAAENNFYN